MEYMCNRFVQAQNIRKYMEIIHPGWNQCLQEEGAPSYILVPRAITWIIRSNKEEPFPSLFRWGFKREKTRCGFAPALVKAEKASYMYPFGESWKYQRCLIPADSWYEWKLDIGEKKMYHFIRNDDQPIFLAGIWTGVTYGLLTVDSDGYFKSVHHRKPVSLETESAIQWIRQGFRTSKELIEASAKVSAFHLLQVENIVDSGCAQAHPPDRLLPQPRQQSIPSQDALSGFKNVNSLP